MFIGFAYPFDKKFARNVVIDINFACNNKITPCLQRDMKTIHRQR